MKGANRIQWLFFCCVGDAEPEARSAIELGLRATIPALIEVSSFQQVFAHKPKAERGDLPIVLVVAPPGDSTFVDSLIKVAAAFSDKIFQILISDEISCQRLQAPGAHGCGRLGVSQS